MQFQTFENKQMIKTNDGEKIDLLSNYMKFDYEKIIIKDWVMIDAGSNGKIDLVSTVAYGQPDYLDYLVKFNRVNNPLYLPTGTILMIPDLNSLFKHTVFIDLNKTSNSMIQKQTKLFNKVTSSSPGTKPQIASNYIKNSNGSYIF